VKQLLPIRWWPLLVERGCLKATAVVEAEIRAVVLERRIPHGDVDARPERWLEYCWRARWRSIWVADVIPRLWIECTLLAHERIVEAGSATWLRLSGSLVSYRANRRLSGSRDGVSGPNTTKSNVPTPQVAG
jgi:hypothetical protein